MQPTKLIKWMVCFHAEGADYPGLTSSYARHTHDTREEAIARMWSMRDSLLARYKGTIGIGEIEVWASTGEPVGAYPLSFTPSHEIAEKA